MAQAECSYDEVPQLLIADSGELRSRGGCDD